MSLQIDEQGTCFLEYISLKSEEEAFGALRKDKLIFTIKKKMKLTKLQSASLPFEPSYLCFYT